MIWRNLLSRRATGRTPIQQFAAEPLEGRLLLAETLTGELDINQLIAARRATVTATPADIGQVSNIFDGDNSSLYRTPNVDPVVVEVSFATPKTVREFTLRFSHAGGNPAYRWKVEAAGGSLPAPPVWTEIVPWTGTPSDVDSTRRRVAHRRRPHDQLPLGRPGLRDGPPVPAAALHRQRD